MQGAATHKQHARHPRDQAVMLTAGSIFSAGQLLSLMPKCAYNRSHRPPGAQQSQPQNASQAADAESFSPAGGPAAKFAVSAPLGALRNILSMNHCRLVCACEKNAINAVMQLYLKRDQSLIIPTRDTGTDMRTPMGAIAHLGQHASK